MISVIVPVYNVKVYLGRCVQSLLIQNQDIEIILVNDGSTDDSAHICDKYALLDSRVKVIHIQNQGVSNARNVGLSLAKGEYITFVDGDDWLSGDFLEIGIKYLEATGADIFIGSYIKNYEDGAEIKVNEDTSAMTLNYEECVEAVFVKSPNKPDLSWAVWGKIFKASLWENVCFDTNLSMGEDAVAFWDVLKHAKKVLYMPVMGYHYRQRADSAIHTPSVKNVLDNLKIYQYFYHDSKTQLDESVQRYFLQRYYVEEIVAILETASQKFDNDQIEQIKKKIYVHICRYFKAAWNLHGKKGVIKVMTAYMPKLIIKAILYVYVITKRSRKVSGFS